MLERFVRAKSREIEMLLRRNRLGLMPLPRTEKRPGFAASLKAVAGPAVIAEYKRASPSKGDINLGVSPREAAAAYAAAGAGAISVLTEETYFKGSLEYLEAMAHAGLPLLRKDFIVHPLQVDATAATSASAVLLIVRMLDHGMLAALLERCRIHGLEAVVEVFDARDLARAKDAGAAIIQVNNSDLDTLRVDFSASHELIVRKERGEFWITASGVRARQDIPALLGLGFDAALVGTSLMEGGDPGAGLAALIGGRHGGA